VGPPLPPVPAEHPIGISEAEIEVFALLLEALGDFLNVPPGRVTSMIAKMKKDLRGQP